jgi:uncharacterized damage-inducible protein DinB
MQTCFRNSERILEVPRLRRTWNELRELPRRAADVMTHGNLVPGNVLVSAGRLAGVIDVGGLGPADPALDLVGAWHLLEAIPRRVFRDHLGCDDLEWERGRAWAFEQAMGLVWYYRESNPTMSLIGRRTLERLVPDAECLVRRCRTRQVGSWPMSAVDEQGRPEAPVAGDEVATLLGFLDYQRATLAWKCAGLDRAGLNATVGVSSMTLGGLLKHMAVVEDHWFSRSLHGHDRHAPWKAVDWRADPDWEWHSAAEDSPEELLALWQEAVARSRSLATKALAEGGLDRLARRTWPDGQAPSLRWIVVHMIEEYARHNGHADLLRESVDGLTGE